MRPSVPAFAALGVLLAALPAAAGPAAIGDLLVPEFGPGTVVVLGDGGDLADAPRLASGLSGPTAVCQGPSGRIYAAEFGSGELTDITDGGDRSDAAPFAWGLTTPVELHCTASQILVVEHLSGSIVDATSGGDLAAARRDATGLDHPTGYATGDGERWIATAAGVVDATGLGDLEGVPPFASSVDLPDPGPTTAVARTADRLLAAHERSGAIFDVTLGGDFLERPLVARVPAPIGLRVIEVAQVERVLVVSAPLTVDGEGAVLDLAACDGADPDGCAIPVATGVRPFQAAGVGEVRSICGDGQTDGDEPCDDADDDPTDACNACRDARCGDGVVQGDEACDDGDADDGDACRADCTVARCGDGAVQRGVEACDPGDEAEPSCNPACQPAVCGDGHVRPDTEECDDGNEDEEDGCTRFCRFDREPSIWGCGAGAGATGALGALPPLALGLALAWAARRRRR